MAKPRDYRHRIVRRPEYHADELSGADDPGAGHSSPSLWQVQTRPKAMTHAGQICRCYRKTIEGVADALEYAKDDEHHFLRPIIDVHGADASSKFAQCFLDLQEFSHKSTKKPLVTTMDMGVFKVGFDLVNSLVGHLQKVYVKLKKAEGRAEIALTKAKHEGLPDKKIEFCDARYWIYRQDRVDAECWMKDLKKMQGDFISLRDELGYDRDWKLRGMEK